VNFFDKQDLLINELIADSILNYDSNNLDIIFKNYNDCFEKLNTFLECCDKLDNSVINKLKIKIIEKVIVNTNSSSSDNEDNNVVTGLINYNKQANIINELIKLNP
jgi:hypothetical protein